MPNNPMDRRTFLAATTTAAAGVAVDATRAQGGTSANARVVIAALGMGGRGTTLASQLAALPGVAVKSVYDVDRIRAEYAAHVVGRVGDRQVSWGQDFRECLDDPDVDAVVVATSNHWHAPATLLACRAGKHVYVEKPCSHNPREGELIVEAAKNYGRLVQHGTQRRSNPSIRQGLARVREGAIGRPYYAHCYYRANRPSIGVGKKVPVPDYLDYELWQGPAPRRPYRDNLIHYNWHWHWHWGNGELGNNGIHRVDIARAALGASYPIHVNSSGGRFHWQNDDQETPDTQIASFRFAGERQITWEALSCNRARPGDSEGDIWIYADAGAAVFTAVGYTLYDEREREVESHRGRGGQQEHLENFIAAIRGEADLNADPLEAHQSTLLCHLGNIAQRKGRALLCDGENGRILNDEDAMSLWQREYEPGWELGVTG